jgi:phosphatidylserine/phosphatidylglycerophosphate/cardiolipin synthase-like enzyme
MVRIDDSAFAAEGRALFDADWARSLPIVAREWKRSRTWAEDWSSVLARFLLTKVDLWLARRQLRSLT